MAFYKCNWYSVFPFHVQLSIGTTKAQPGHIWAVSEIAKGWFGKQGRQQRAGADPVVNSKGFYGEVPGVCALGCKQQQ